MSSEMFDKGLAMRKRVLGAEHVEKSLAAADQYTRPLQELVTEYCWGAVWNRPGLEPKTRSMLNIGMLTALNRPHELKVHIVGALTNGCTREEIIEVLLQTAVYCGMPAALESTRIAREVFREQDAK
jgi:4-carboxymuconolactone decarboxylase